MKKITLLIILIITLASSAIAAAPFSSLLCHSSGFSCLKIEKGKSWNSLWPDKNQQELIQRLNRMNTSLHRGMIIAVPNDLSKTNLMDYSPFSFQINAAGEKLLVFNPKINAWAAYDANGKLIKWGPASGGATWCRDLKRPCRTASGNFRIYAKGSPRCISHKFPLPNGGSPMPFCMFFHGGQAFHGAPDEVPGYNASHGCVRLFVTDAKWLNQEFVELPNSSNGYKGTKVSIIPYKSK